MKAACVFFFLILLVHLPGLPMVRMYGRFGVPPLNQSDFDYERSGDDLMTDEEKLFEKLMTKYSSVSRPVYDASKSVVVTFGLALVQIQGMNEIDQVLTTYVWYEHVWFDERLYWNPINYHNLTIFRVPGNFIWVPDIELYNSAHVDTNDDHQTRAMIRYDGRVFYAPLAKLSSTCRIDITFYPFDCQICKLKFGSWTYDNAQLEFINKSDTVDLENYIPNGEWDLEDVRVVHSILHYPCCPGELYPDVTFYLHLQRRSLFYWTNMIFPCVWLTVINIVSFALPPESGERVSLGISVFLSFSVFMLLVAENTPSTSDTVPLLGQYLAVAMSLNAGCLLAAVMLYNFYHSSPFARKRLPVWARKLLKSKMGAYFDKNRTQGVNEIRMDPEGGSLNPHEDKNYYPEAFNVDKVSRRSSINPGLRSLYNRRSSSLSRDMKNTGDNMISGPKWNFAKLLQKIKNDKMQVSVDPKSGSRISLDDGQVQLNLAQQRRKCAQGVIMREWKMLTHMLDRILLIVFLVASIFTNVFFLFIVPATFKQYSTEEFKKV